MKFLSDLLAKAGLTVDGVTQLNTVANATTDTDKFLVSDGGVVKYRTGAQLGSDIGPGNLSVSTVKHLVKLGEAATKGQAVYVSSADGTNMIVSKASNASEPTSSKTLGLLETGGVLNDQVYVVTEGLLSGLNTATANAGDPVWLGTNGEIIYGLLNRPYAPAHLVFIGIVTRVQQNNGEIFVKVQNGFELQELHNVQITTTPSDNTVLSYETSTSLYKMKSIATLLGYTPLSGSGTTNYLPKWTGTTALGNSLIYDNGSAIGINTSSPFSSSAFKLDVNGGVLIKNTNGTAAQLVLIDSDPAAGGNNGFVQLTAGGNTSTAFGQWQTYYGASIASGVLRLQPAGGYVLIGSSTAVTGAGMLQVSGDVNITGSFKINGVTLASGGVTSFNTRTGAITLSSSDVTTALGFTPIGSYSETDTLASVTSRGASTSLAITALKFSQTSHSTTLSNSSYSNEAAVYANAGSGANVYPGYGFHKSGELGLFLYATNRSTLRMRGDDGSDNLIYHSGNLTNLNQLTNGPGYITSYTEVDTLASVTGRGASTSTNVTFNGTLTSAGQTVLAGAFRFYTGGTDGSTAYGDFRTNPATGNSIISAKSNALYFNYDHGTGGVIFCDGATGIVATVNAAGVAVFNGNVTGASFIKSGGTSSQFLKADGSVDSSTYLTTGTASSTYLPLAGGTMTGQLLSPSMGTGVYEGAIQLRETGYVGSGQSAWGYAPAITFHWGNRWVKRFGGRYDGLFAIDDEPIALQSWVNSQGYVVSSSSSFTTAGTGWYRVATTAGDGRGYYYVELYTTGGNHNPSYLRIEAMGDWGSDKLIAAYTDLGFPANAVRITRSATTTFLEVNFTSTILGASMRVVRLGFDSTVSVLSGALSAGGGTVQETLTIAGKINAASMSIAGNTVLHAGNYTSYAVPTSRTITINGTSYDLSSNRSWTVTASETDTLATVTARGASTTAGITVNGRLTANAGGTYAVTGSSTQRYIIQALNTSNSVNSSYGWWWFHNANGDMGFHADAVGDILTLTRGGGASVNGNTILTAGNYTSYTYSTTDADSRFLRGTTNPGSVNNFTISIGNNGTYSYVQSHAGQPLRLNPVGNTIYLDAVTYAGTIYANILYDSDNSGYYVNPASTSYLNALLLNQTYGAYNHLTYGGYFSGGDWQSLTNTEGQINVVQVNNINGGGYSNQAPNVYTYGAILSWRTVNHSFQLYASHTGDITFKTQWSNDNYSGWRRILHESNYNSWAPSLTGGGASGTWGINITGTAASETLSTVTGRGNSTGSNIITSANSYANTFYDYADNGYYFQGRGISRMYGIAIRGDNNSTGSDNQIFFWGGGNSTTSAIGFKANGGAFGNPTGFGDGYNTYLTMDTDGRGWVFRRGVGGTDFSSAYTSGWILNNGVWQANSSMRAPIFYDSNDTGYYVDPNDYSRLNKLVLNQSRVNSSRYPIGHYTSGETVFEIDPTWSNDQLQAYFNSGSVAWTNDSGAPGGYAIRIDGSVNVGGAYSSGFPYIPVDQDDIFYMECWIKSVSGTITHYMGSIDYDSGFSSLGGNPGSFGYWTMSNTSTSTSWQKVAGYITGFGGSTGQFVNGTKYWTPQALFNYGQISGSSCVISGWKVIKVGHVGNRTFRNNITVSGQINLGTTTTRLIADVATGYLKLYGSASNYLGIGPYNNNGWLYFENIGNSNGVYFNSPGRYAFDSVDVTPYNDAENSLGNPSYRWAQVYTSGWFRNYGAQGMYNQDYGTHFYSSGTASWNITGSGGNIELVFRSNHQSTVRGYVYADTSNQIGFLHSGGGWSLRTTSDKNAFIHGQTLTINADNAGWSSIYMNDGDEGMRELHCNSNRIGFLNQSGSWGSWCDDSGNWLTGAGVYAGIFYDYDNGGYYLDPNSTSNLLHIQMPHRGNGTPNILVNNGGSENWGAIHIEGGSGNLRIGKSDAGRSWSGRVSLAMHVGASESFRVHSDGWDSLFEVWGSSGYARLKGSLEVGSDVYLGVRGTWLSSWLNQNVTTGASPTFSEVTAGYHRSYYLTGRYDVSVDHTYGIYFQNYVDYSYAIFRESGAWSHPYPDLRIAFHTGIKIGAYYGYNGTRFYNNSDMATITASVNDGDNNFRGYYDIIAYASDRRLKENIQVIDNAIDKVKQLTGMTYTWNSVGSQYGWTPSKEREAGVFAQEVQNVLPEAVKLAPFDQGHDEYGNSISKSGQNFLTVKYEKIVPLLIEAIKEQQLQIEELQNKLDNVLSSR